MYEPSRHLDTFCISGFQHHDGALILRQLEVGMTLDLVAEPDNPYDHDAIAIKFHGAMLGYVPAKNNVSLSLMMFYGHADTFECRILQVDPTADPWKQVRVGLYVKDARRRG